YNCFPDRVLDEPDDMSPVMEREYAFNEEAYRTPAYDRGQECSQRQLDAGDRQDKRREWKRRRQKSRNQDSPKRMPGDSISNLVNFQARDVSLDRIDAHFGYKPIGDQAPCNGASDRKYKVRQHSVVVMGHMQDVNGVNGKRQIEHRGGVEHGQNEQT